MRGGELVLALVVSKLIYIYSKSQERYCSGKTKQEKTIWHLNIW